ncbi:TetR/AcrR family transcriptional regulator [Streptomyces armeniacus]|uniref:TetR/AcrR family transcriptional regulator n=1 Tax=Streptomyces armeniacus TaxID=83291 RepID=A0A345XIB1_9ACTN|nr:TetR/AcrR family transcriptional regulator [Streptomyces armeniacus]AXK31377.1 TetR/AcrR family transcriptional regulator [Streptomyces armeniacus]
MAADSSQIAPAASADASDRLRADAERNRNRILDAAREAFAVRGLDVPMAAIARRAGVGVATLYRRFPTRESLVTEVFADQLASCAAVVDEALADPDPWRGFCTVVEKVCRMQLADRGFTAAFLSEFPDAVDFDRQRAHAERGFDALTRRAQEAGRLRADFHPDDLTLVLMANDGITAEAAGSAEAAAAASRRLVAFLLRSFRATPSVPVPPLPPPAAVGLCWPKSGPSGA